LTVWDRLLEGSPATLRQATATALELVRPQWQAVSDLVLANQVKVLQAFQAAKVADIHFAASTGYGYGDIGREKIEEVFARTFRTEAALVRAQIVSGTHAIACGLFGALRPGARLIAAAGTPYDTLRQVIAGPPGSLAEWGVAYEEVALHPDGSVDLQRLTHAVTDVDHGVVFIQRSRGYSLRPSLTVAEIGRIIDVCKGVNPHITCLVDNCYGEFVEELEPSEVGADIICGSLIKNPGGGVASTGGYVAGRRDLVERAAARLVAPGIGTEVGPNHGVNRSFLQGFFLAPHVTGEALRGAQFTAALFATLGFRVRPAYDAVRTDLVQAVELGTAAGLIAFCEAVQRSGPVDAHVRPEPWDMPGYTDQVIMAAGTFVQGSSIELSADGPVRPPYTAYLQGGLTAEHVLWSAVNAARVLLERGIVPGY